eukprot:jgi/Tetstr1/452293/TSEL_039329.t1
MDVLDFSDEKIIQTEQIARVGSDGVYLVLRQSEINLLFDVALRPLEIIPGLVESVRMIRARRPIQNAIALDFVFCRIDGVITNDGLELIAKFLFGRSAELIDRDPHIIHFRPVSGRTINLVGPFRLLGIVREVDVEVFDEHMPI